MNGIARSSIRTVKNYTKGYSDVQTKVRDATSNDPWGPSGTQMNEIAQLTYNQQDFVEVMEMLDKRLNDKGKNWRHVFKSLTLLDYLLHAGSENVVLYFRENAYIIKTLKEFQYIDDEGKDQGANVRQKAKDISNLLMDEARLRDERKSRSSMRDRMSGRSGSDDPDADRSRRRAKSTSSAPPRPREDDDLAKAIEASKRSAADEERRTRGKVQQEDDLAKALRLSQEEEARRLAELARARGNLFDDQAERNNDLVDLSGPPTQQPMMTGMPQFQSYNPYAQYQQQLLEQQQQEEYMRMMQQQEAQRQMEAQMAHQQQMEAQRQAELQAQQQAQYQAYLQQQAMQQQYAQQQPLVPQPTAFGSNNPFSQGFQPQQTATPPPMPSYQPAPASVPSAPASPAPAARPAPQQRPPKSDGDHAKLAALLAAGGGIDTFGNRDDMRVPVGSPFHPSNRLGAQPTGASAFGQQRTGGGFGSAFAPNASQQQQQQQQQSQRPQQSGQDQPFFSL